MGTYQQDRARAKELGLNTFQKDHATIKAMIQAKLAGQQSQERPTVVSQPGREERPQDREERPRRKRRTPLGAMRQKLSYPQRPGYVRRWVNDHRGRLKSALEGDWAFVEEDQGGRKVRVSRMVGTKEDGSPMMAFCMEIRQEFYDEDQAEKQEPLDDFDAQLRRGVANPRQTTDADRGQFYTPKDGTSIEVST